MKALEESLRNEAYNNLSRRYDAGNLQHVQFTKTEIIREFEEKFKHVVDKPTSLGDRGKIRCHQLQSFIKQLTIQKEIEEEFESVQKNFYRNVKNCKS